MSTHKNLGARAVPLKEINNHPQGRSGGGTLKHKGPVGATPGNKTSGGGINRRTKGKS